jgi:hypothetical protein
MIKWNDLKVGMKIFHTDATSRGLNILFIIKEVTPEYFAGFRYLMDYGKIYITNFAKSEKKEWQNYSYEIRGYDEIDNDWWYHEFIRNLFSHPVFYEKAT